MPSRIRKFIGLPSADKLLVLRAAFGLLAISIALRLISFSRLKRFCQQVAQCPTPDPLSWIRHVTYAINAATTVIPGSACLARALVCQRMSGAAGISTELKIGVARNTENLIHAHAWLEYEGKVIMGDSSELPIYSRL